MTTTPLVEIRGGSFGYDERIILRDVELRVSRGEFLGVLGANGSGKSTLLKGLLGLISPIRGEVIRYTRKLGYVPQRESLDDVFPLSVGEVALMGTYGRKSGVLGVPKAERDFALECLDRVGLADRAADLYSRLSGGQRQRVLIARALAMKPELLLLDEPTTGIDERAQAVVSELLDELNTRSGVSVVCVTHDPQALVGHADQVIRVESGLTERGELRADDRRGEVSADVQG